jgi:O-antigen/teichoic acid export membrane protein
MSNATTFVRNLCANWTGHVVNLVVMFFLSPFVVHSLGNVEYGIWSLLTLLTGYMGVLDVGIRASTGRYIILYMGRGEHNKVDQTIRTSLGIFSIIGFGIVAVGAGLGWFFVALFPTSPAEYHATVKLLLPLLAANVWISMVRVLFSSVLGAHDRFEISNGMDLVALALRTGGTILALKWGMGIVGLSVVVVASNFAGLLGNHFLARRIYPQLRIWPPLFLKERLYELYSYGIFAFISAVSGKIIGQTDLFIAGAIVGVESVTIYSVGAMLSFYTSSFIQLIANTFFPSVQKAIARNEMGSARWLFFRQIRLAIIFGLPIYTGFCFFAEPFMKLWMFDPKIFPMESVHQSALVLTILAVSNLPILMESHAQGLLSAMGHVKLTAILSIIEALLNLGLSLFFVLALDMGLVGIAAGTLVSRILIRFFVTLKFTFQKANVSWKSFVWQICARFMPVFLILSGLCLLMLRILPSTSWGWLFLQIILVMTGYLPIAFWIMVPPNDRQRILSGLKSIIVS